MWDRADFIEYMALVDLADAMGDAAENYNIDDINIPRADLLDTVPEWFRANDLDINKYLDLKGASRMFDAAQKAIGVDLVELANAWADQMPTRYENDVPYYVYMMSVGHGVGFYDSPDLEELIQEMGGNPRARWGYYEFNYEGALQAFIDAGYDLDAEEE